MSNVIIYTTHNELEKKAAVNHELTIQQEGKRKIRQNILPRFQAGAWPS